MLNIVLDMENKETKSNEVLLIKDITEKESKAGRKYFSVETDKGTYSVFEFDLAQTIGINKGNQIQCECASNDRGFKNIRKFLSVVEIQKIGTPATKEIARENYMENKSTTMYVSYAKDLFCQLIAKAENCEIMGAKNIEEAVMQRSINLVKQAKESFK